MLRECLLRCYLGVAIIALSTHAVVGAEPKRWVDDFTTEATYDYVSWLAPCSGGASTKYTVFDVIDSSVIYARAVSGKGKLTVGTSVIPSSSGSARYQITVIGVVNLGQGCGDTPEVRYWGSTESFTNDYVCIYGGFSFNDWQLKSWEDPEDPFGPDGAPGVANVDDDRDGMTDEVDDQGPWDCGDESPAQRPTTVQNGYGYRNGTGFKAGLDDAPGVVGVDDDGNGTTDDIGETGSDGSDDGDDTPGLANWAVLLRGRLYCYQQGVPYKSMLLHISPNSEGGDRLAIAEVATSDEVIMLLEGANELAAEFYDPGTDYNYVFCADGDCYGAILWTGANLANPDETLGPLVSTEHSTVDDSLVGFQNGFQKLGTNIITGSSAQGYVRQNIWRGNRNFSYTYWVIEGNPDNNQEWNIPSVTADFDEDLDVDGQDFMEFSKCFNGSLRPPKPTCEHPEADFDEDLDVDGQDFMAFSKCFNGSLRRPKAVCLAPLWLADCTEKGGGGGGQGGEEWATIIDGESPELDVFYVYTPTCTGAASFALCPTQDAKLPDGEIVLAFFDGVDIALLGCVAGDDCVECESLDDEGVTLTQGKDVYLLFFAEEPIEGLDNLTLDVRCE